VTRALGAAVERAWTADDAGSRLLRALLVPAAAAYGAAVAVRNAAYDRGLLAVARVPALVVSVGNLSVGGTGKTPAALWLAERLAARGRRVAIVARGYRKRRRGVVVVGTGAGPLVDPDDGGDEAVMLARRFAGPVVAAERRADAAAHACRAFGCDAIVLDDGFQHRALHRDADLVLVAGDPRALRLLPAGPLREPAVALRRARAVLLLDGTPAGARPGGAVGAAWPPTFRGRIVPRALVRPQGAAWIEEGLGSLAGVAVVAVAGVARPERFLASLAACGARVTRHLRFPDHHRYGAEDVRAIAAAAREAPLVTTEKDLVKLERHGALSGLRALRVALEVDDGEALVADLVAAWQPDGQVASRAV